MGCAGGRGLGRRFTSLVIKKNLKICIWSLAGGWQVKTKNTSACYPASNSACWHWPEGGSSLTLNEAQRLTAPHPPPEGTAKECRSCYPRTACEITWASCFTHTHTHQTANIKQYQVKTPPFFVVFSAESARNSHFCSYNNTIASPDGCQRWVHRWRLWQTQTPVLFCCSVEKLTLPTLGNISMSEWMKDLFSLCESVK